jgi:hypothetical protein
VFDADQHIGPEGCLGCGEDIDTSVFKPLGENCGISENQRGLRSVTGFFVKTCQDIVDLMTSILAYRNCGISLIDVYMSIVKDSLQ